MPYTAAELARAAGLFLVTDADVDHPSGVHVEDGVAYLAAEHDAHQLATQAVRMALGSPESAVREAVEAHGFEYREPVPKVF